MLGRSTEEPTRPLGEASQPPASRRRARFADLVLGASQAEWSEEVRALLERRLKAISIITCLANAAFLVNLFVVSGLGSRMTRAEIGAIVAADACELVAIAFVFARRRPSLRLLRAAETTVLLATFVALFVWGHGWLARGAWLEGAASPAVAAALSDRPWAISAGGAGSVLHVASGGSLLGQRIVVTWGLVAVTYGAVIPNTWRRCAAVMALMMLLPLAIEVVAALDSDAFRPMLGTVLFPSFYMMAAFAGTGLYGCHKLDVLRRAAFDARHVGQYRLVRELGRGGMGEVYLAEHRHLRRPCAVKLIREGGADRGRVARFEREVQSMARLTHPNTVEVYDYGRTEDGTFFYAMEFLPGMTLEQLVESSGPLAAGRAIHLLRQACGALAEAHSLGFIHRDVKPANLFVCERGGLHDFLKILDFGIVQDRSVAELPGAGREAGPSSSLVPAANGRLTQGGAILGTPAYVSPEQVRGEPADARSDVYALGGVAFHLLTGAPPFSGRDAFELCIAHLDTEPPHPRERNPEVPADLDAVVVRCLAKDPAERFQSVLELDAALAACGAASTWGSEAAAAWWIEHGAATIRPGRSGPASTGALTVTRAEP